MKNFFCTAVAAAMICTVPDFSEAGTVGPISSTPNLTYVATLSAGPVWAEKGTTQTFFLAPGILKSYVADNSTSALASGEIFLGIQKKTSSPWYGQLGLAAAFTGNATLQGVIWDDAQSQFDNLIYRYQVQHSRISVKGKLLVDTYYSLIPWISGSAGVGFNRAHNYSNRPIIFEALPNANFSNRSQTAFTYSVGAGVQKALNLHWQVGIGYEFADWGKNQLGRAFEQTLNSGLKVNHLYTNGVLFNLTYIA